MCEVLAASHISLMVTGSVAAGYRDAGRATMDVDAVMDPTPTQLSDFATRVERAGLYVSADAAQEALVVRGMYNVGDPASGWKADFLIRKARPFSEAEFTRREEVALPGVPLAVTSVGNSTTATLEKIKLGASAREIEDARALLCINA